MQTPEFWSGRDPSARLACTLLAPIGLFYGATIAWKRDHAQAWRARAKVVCIGNLTVGGTGKTPIAIAIGKMLLERGLKTVFLSRGYGGKEHGPVRVSRERDSAAQVGDEPLLLAGAAPTIVSRDRRAGAELADAAQADVIVMDDGHQNFALAKDLSLVVVDAQTGFGNGHVLPAGPLRESAKQGLARADAVILSGDGNPDLGNFQGAVLRVHLKPLADRALLAKPVVAFAGTGRPDKFFATLAALGAQIVDAIPFPDHHEYAASELARLKAKAKGNGAQLITTEKDYVRLSPADREAIAMLPVAAQFDDDAALNALLDRLTAPR
ncbi:MAG TPA: tetraacyldisaccharide 4'-kinase [Rhizomicrobium sp.]|jgi:tetraacyldisaccharide 4'-kinase